MPLVKRHPLITFFVLAYALSWWFVLIDPKSLFPWGPSLAAIIVVALTRGTCGLKALLRRLILWRVGWTWYAAALGIPIVVTLTSVYLNVLLGAPAPSAAELSRFYMFFVVFPVIFLLGPLGEELGWRGFALPRFAAQLSERGVHRAGGGVSHAGEQAFIDRRFYRRRNDGRKALERFSTKLRDETELETLNKDLVDYLVRETI